jgi:methylmalonyl-CoA carboxyltransferase large subunit
VNLTDLIRALSERQFATERQLGALSDAVKALQARVEELRAPAHANADGAAKDAAHGTRAEVTPEVLVMIAAAVTAFLGKKVRIRSAKVLQSPYEVVNPWSQQGRVSVQASHNFRSRS